MSDSQNEQLFLFPDLSLRAKDNLATQEAAKVKSAPNATAAPKKPEQNRKPRAARESAPAIAIESDSPLISDQAVAKRYSVSRPTIWRWTNMLLGFPQPIKLSGGTTRWKLADLQAFDRSRSEDPSQPRRKIGKVRAT